MRCKINDQDILLSEKCRPFHEWKGLIPLRGDHFSAGQRQLICIGRVLQRMPCILVMDEATASIDSETDNFIQKMIRQKFENVTSLCVQCI